MAKIVKKPMVRKAEIVKAASYLFQTKGYEKTTMQDVMSHLDIAKGTIYHYFKSKEALLESAIENMVMQNILKIQNLLQKAKGNALEKMRFLIEKGNMANDNADILDHLHRSSNANMHLRLLTATLLKLAPLYGKIIQEGCDEGIFQTEAPMECAEFILFAVQFLTDRGIYPWTQEDLLRRSQAFPKLIEQQLKASPGSFQFLINLM